MFKPISLSLAGFQPIRLEPVGFSGGGGGQTNTKPVAPASPVVLGPIVVGEPIVITAAQLLYGVSDPDGDELSVTSLSVTTGSGTITGTGPWTFSASTEGDVVISYTISDGQGHWLELQLSVEIVAELPAFWDDAEFWNDSISWGDNWL